MPRRSAAVDLPAVARHFKLAVMAGFYTVSLIFGGWILSRAVEAAGEHTSNKPVAHIVSAAALTGAALSFLLAVADDWRLGIPVHRNPKFFAGMLPTLAVPTVLVLA